MNYASLYTSSFSGEEHEFRLRIERRLSASPFLAKPLRSLGYNSSEEWAWDEYTSTVLALVEQCRESGRQESGAVRLLEIGGGRSPLLTPAEAAEAGIELTVNDIDARELAQAPESFEKAQFDISGDIHSTWEGSFDLVISRMVFGHLRDARRGWANVLRLLAPGGVALAFHPTLYAPPFLINRLMPEEFAARIRRRFFPDRHDGDGAKKFPARYEMGFSDPAKIEPILKRLGYSEVLVAPFWRHGHFRHIPLLREADDALQDFAEKRDWRKLSTYAYTLARR
jgi:SAM-dependent methyltransferase